MSPTAHANPYFAHQGPPVLRHYNAGSVPPSPPDTPKLHVSGAGPTDEQASAAGKERLARRLRRVASAPDAQGLFSTNKGKERPQTADLEKVQIDLHGSESSDIDNAPPDAEEDEESPLQIPKSQTKIPLAGQLRQSIAFRRTYSSNSIKVRNVEVGPSSFDKIKLIGKGDVGKVYLVREKKSNRLYAMKGSPV